LKEQGYAGIDEVSKVRRLLDGIQFKPMEPCKLQIYSSPTLSTDFDACVDLINNFILGAGLAYSEGNAQISSTTATKSGGTGTRGGGSKGGKTVSFGGNTKGGATTKPANFVNVPDRYYTPEEYGRMDNDSKQSLKWSREQKGNRKGKGGNSQEQRKRAPSTMINPEWAARIAALEKITAKKAKTAKTVHPSLRKSSASSDDESNE
jgi:hypothetical protein